MSRSSTPRVNEDLFIHVSSSDDSSESISSNSLLHDPPVAISGVPTCSCSSSENTCMLYLEFISNTEVWLVGK